MATAERTATTVWEGDLPKGRGTLTLRSGATGDLPVTWASRSEKQSEGKTSPEELIAGAHELLLPSRDEEHARPFLAEPPARRQADALAGAGHDAHLSLQPEVHGRHHARPCAHTPPT